MSKRDLETSIWLRPEPGERRARLTREKIAATALSVADAEGFEAVSMRRVAALLGASTMSLYYYVRTKADLVALMDDALMGEMLVSQDELRREWREAVSTIAHRTREVLVRHPWVLQSMQGAPPGPNAMRHFEQCLEAMADAPMSQDCKVALLQLVDDFVFGHSLRTAEAGASLSGHSNPRHSAETLAQQLLKTGAFPRTAALFAQVNTKDIARQRTWLTEDRFDRALEAVLDGAAKRFCRDASNPRRSTLKRVRRNRRKNP